MTKSTPPPKNSSSSTSHTTPPNPQLQTPPPPTPQLQTPPPPAPSLPSLQQQLDNLTLSTNMKLDSLASTFTHKIDHLLSILPPSTPNSSLHIRPQFGSFPRFPQPNFTPLPDTCDATALRGPNLRLDAPKFDGSDPNGWIFRVEEYFEFYTTAPADRLRLVGLFMEGAASEWFRWVRNNIILTSWEEFVSQIRLRFDPHHFEDYFGALSNLKQTSSVAAYQTDFERLLNKVTGVPEAALLSVFIAGLKPHLRHEMNLRRPPSLSAAFALARELSALHQETHVAALAQQGALSDAATYTATITPDSSRPSATSSRPEHHSLPIRKLSFAEKQIKDAQGLCYNCDQKWSRSHRCQSRLLLLFSNDEPDEDIQPAAMSDHHDEVVADDISLMNSLSSVIHPRSLHLKGTIHTTPVHILIDGGSNHNFIHPRLVESLKLPVQHVYPFRVYVGNGDYLACSQQCPTTPLTMQGSNFTVDLFVLAIHGPDIVLGVQWLQMLGTVTHNYANLTMEFNWEGNRVGLQGDTSILCRNSLHHLYAMHVATHLGKHCPDIHLPDKVVLEPPGNDTNSAYVFSTTAAHVSHSLHNSSFSSHH